jgi:hypothetical protein
MIIVFDDRVGLDLDQHRRSMKRSLPPSRSRADVLEELVGRAGFLPVVDRRRTSVDDVPALAPARVRAVSMLRSVCTVCA